MARPKDEERRAELLAAVVAVYAEGGIGARSLRDVADAAGTSHRMLLHHFESREGLLVAVVEAVEARQQDRLKSLYANSSDWATVLDDMWAGLVADDIRPLERLFFECYARGANGESPFDRLHSDSVTTWLSISEDYGVDADLVRLGLAVMRGLLLDLTVTDDVDGVTEAMRLYFDLVAARAFPTP